MKAFTIAAPRNLDAALAEAGQPDAKFIAGGTDLLPLMKDMVERPKRLVDLAGLPLDEVTLDDGGARIGALVPMADLADHAEIRRQYPVVTEALLASASPQVRNMATVGGNLLQRTRCGYFRDAGSACNKRAPGSGCPAIAGDHRRLAILGGSDKCIATHASDLAVALAALDAAVELRGPAGTRVVPVNDFYVLPGGAPERETVMTPGELITAILLPMPGAGEQSHYLKLRERASFEFALVSAAIIIARDGEVIRAARIAMGGIGTRPWRLPALEAALAGQPATQTTFTAAAEHAAEGARPLAENRFKIPLMRRVLVRALVTATA